MTMKELATLANVSVSTVSKAFSDAEDVGEDTKKLIFEIAKAQGCYGKFAKKKFHKKIIAVICPELGSSFYTGYVERLQRIIEKNGGIAVVSTDNFNAQAQEELVDYYASHLHVDGIFVISMKSPLKRGYDIPIVSVLGDTDNTVDSVNVDIKQPMFDAVQLLRSLGHSKIAFIGEQLTSSKAELFCKAMKIPDYNSAVIVSNHRFEKAGEEGVVRLIEKKIDCSAIICAYDDIAVGAIKQLKRLGYNVPGDFSVIGIDNINITEYTETALTTIDTQPDEVCMIAWDLMQKKLKNKFYRSNQNITVSGRLIVRETVSRKKADLF